MSKPAVTPSDITVVVPIYNGADKLPAIIHSFSNQSSLPHELILVDDGSTDNIHEVFETFSHYPWLTYIRKPNGGPASARNYGLNLAKTRYVAFLDADDKWHPSKIERQLETINNYSGSRALGIIDCFVEVLSKESNKIIRKRNKINTGNIFEKMFYTNCINGTSSVIVDRNYALNAGGFPEDVWFGEDRMLWHKLAEHYDSTTTPCFLVTKINSDSNLTSRTKENYVHIIRYVEEMASAYHREKDIEKLFFKNTEIVFNTFCKEGDIQSVRQCFKDSLFLSASKTILSRRFLFYLLTLPGTNFFKTAAIMLRKA